MGCKSTDPAAVHANVVEPILPTENIIFYDNIEVNRKEVKVFVHIFLVFLYNSMSFVFIISMISVR